MGKLTAFVTSLILMACTPLPSGSSGQGGDKTVNDSILDPGVKSVLLYPSLNLTEIELLPSVIPLGNKAVLNLEFDYLGEDYRALNVKILHCDADWKKSSLFDLDFLYEYNEFLINETDFSIDTRVPYTHYSFQVPPVKIPGNYALVVYPEDAPSEILFSKRFMVFDQRVAVRPGNNVSGGLLSFSRVNQQLNFNIDYGGTSIENPWETVKVVVRQNQRWDNALYDLRPSSVNEGLSTIEYRYFDFEKTMPGFNEFRFFDLQSVRFFGQNVQTVDILDNSIKALVMTDKTRSYQAYGQYRDRNGGYILTEADGVDYRTDSEYIDVDFRLESDYKGEVHIIGKLSNWEITEQNKMSYFPEKGQYRKSLLLKQGFYDYAYYLNSDSLDHHHFEGNHFETENEYEIFIYYRPITSRSDQLIGYFNTILNFRN